MGYYLGSRALPMDRPWKTETAQYPANWLRLSSTADRAAIGVTWGADEGTWDQRFYWGVDNPKQWDDVTDEDGNTTTGLKTQWKATQNEIAASLLAPSDLLLVRRLRRCQYRCQSSNQALLAVFSFRSPLLSTPIYKQLLQMVSTRKKKKNKKRFGLLKIFFPSCGPGTSRTIVRV